ncbi:MAG: rRNA pseudouridine synthase [Clostridia bacterium]|nr:rRNA pseudouridine synthase [Clostridia bacterium]
MELIKLQKYFTDCGVLSRRAAEEEIRLGRVLVNGAVAELGVRIDPDRDIVEYGGKQIRPTQQERICVLLNKPRGYLTTLSDDRGRHTVAELVGDVGRRVYPIGRLDMDSDGLLLLTDDGALANRLTHPRHEIPKIYRVTVQGPVGENQLSLLRQAMVLDGYEILPVQTKIVSASPDSTVLEMRLYEGRNRQIRKMCQQADLTVKRLCRIAIGELTLGRLPTGKWRQLSSKELAYLRGETSHLPK